VIGARFVGLGAMSHGRSELAELRFVVAAKPHGKDRPRTELRFRALHGLASALAAASRGGRKAQVKVLKTYVFAHFHTTEATDRFETLVAGSAHVARGWARKRNQALPEAPYEVEIVAVMPRPQRVRGEGRQPCGAVQVKPDINNVLAAVLDGLQRGPMGGKREKGGRPPGVIVDDALVQRVVASKVYAAEGEAPCVEVVLRSLASVLP